MGNPLTLTWGFAATGTSIPSFGTGPTGTNNLIARMDAIYGAGPGGSNLTQRPWFSLYQGTFNRWSSISGLSYVYEAADDGVAFSGTNGPANRGVFGVRADVRIAGRNIDGNSNVLAFNFYPNVGDMVIDTNDNFFENTASNSIRLRNVVTHEHGHGVGMPHVDTPSSTPQGNRICCQHSKSVEKPTFFEYLGTARRSRITRISAFLSFRGSKYRGKPAICGISNAIALVHTPAHEPNLQWKFRRASAS
jgi:hypothetical protein